MTDPLQLAVKNKATPAGFKFNKCLTAAKDLLPYAFEKDDAKEKYGGENVFSSVVSGKPSLRHVAEMVYGYSSPNSSGDSDEVTEARKLRESIENKVKFPSEAETDERIFKDVGGIDIWYKLYNEMTVIATVHR